MDHSSVCSSKYTVWGVHCENHKPQCLITQVVHKSHMIMAGLVLCVQAVSVQFTPWVSAWSQRTCKDYHLAFPLFYAASCEYNVQVYVSGGAGAACMCDVVCMYTSNIIPRMSLLVSDNNSCASQCPTFLITLWCSCFVLKLPQ